MTQYEVASSANISLRTYQRYEKDERIPDIEKAFFIAKALNSTVEELFNAN
jgi:transcriptional regulator with XRE-family HTH domain